MRSWGVIMFYLIGLEGSDNSSNDVRGIFPICRRGN